MTALGGKRVRPWEDCDDVAALKGMLSKQHDQLTKLKKENTDLKQALNTAEVVDGNALSPTDLAASTARISKAIKASVCGQMVYKSGVKCKSVVLIQGVQLLAHTFGCCCTWHTPMTSLASQHEKQLL